MMLGCILASRTIGCCLQEGAVKELAMDSRRIDRIHLTSAHEQRISFAWARKLLLGTTDRFITKKKIMSVI